MAFPPSFIDELIARNPIEDVVGQYVSLKRSGSNLFGLCPFHGEKTASFSVAPDKGIYYCFGCHAGGSALNFVMEMEHLEFKDAVKLLAEQVHMELPELVGGREDAVSKSEKERIYEANKQCARFFHSQLWKQENAQVLSLPRLILLRQMLLSEFLIRDLTQRSAMQRSLESLMA